MGVLRVRVNGVWEDVVGQAEPPLDEVWVGTTPPDPVGTYEIWMDTSTIPFATIKYKDASGAWQPADTGSEVEVGPVDPYVTDPKSKAELWHDTSLGQEGKLKVRIGTQWHHITETVQSEVEAGATDPKTYNSEVELWVDTSQTPVVLKAWVNGAWVDAGTASSGAVPEEVNIGPAQPYRDVTVELWYDTTTSPGVLKANNYGTWESIAGTSEIWVGVVDPYVVNVAATDELWWQPDEKRLYARVQGKWDIALEQSVNEIMVSDIDPSVVNPQVEMWYDTSTTP